MKFEYSDWFLKSFGYLFATYWNTKWSKNNVYYTIKKGERKQIVSFLKECTQDYSAIRIAREEGFHDIDGTEETLYRIEQWVIKNIKYVSDTKQWHQVEYWQLPKETILNQKGDCEDYSCLIYALAITAGVPAWRLKLCAGNVKSPQTGKLGGHAYLIFLRNDMTWCAVDGTYYPSKLRLHLRKKHKEIEYYKDIWWTANSEFSWSQKDTNIEFSGLDK